MSRLSDRLRAQYGTRGHARLRVGLVFLGILVPLTFGASTAYDAQCSYDDAIHSANRELENLASALAEQTAWS